MPTKILVPAYFYPAGNTYWADLANLAANNPITAIMNPSNGPNLTVDPNYATAASNLVAAGGSVVGYVYSSYGNRDIALVKADIATYIALYPQVTGFFIDEMSNLAGNVAYYQELHDYIKSLSSSYTIIGNPGATTLESYIPTADVIVTFEGSGASYANYVPDAWMANYDASHFSHLVYGVANSAAALAAEQHALTTGGGNIYITNDTYIPGNASAPNPWDTLSSYYLNNVVNGDAANNVLYGSTGNDTLNGLAGNDSLDGGAGADTLIGGIGNDTYSVDNAGDIVTELLNSGIDTVKSSINYSLIDTDGAGTNGGNVENLTLIGSDVINGSGNALANMIIGNTAYNVLTGGLGNDTIDGGTGSGDSLAGGIGNDTYIVDDLTDTLVENTNEGTDTIQSSTGLSLNFYNNIENLSLTGSANINAWGSAVANVLTGNDGNNQLIGDGVFDTIVDIDTLKGGKGDDTYFVNLTQVGTNNATATVKLEDSVLENVSEGIDEVNLTGDFSALTTASTIVLGANIEKLRLDSATSNTTKLNITGNILNNTFVGNSVANKIDGGAGNDVIYGGAGNDTLLGGAGNDDLLGMTGVDDLQGGTGNDRYYVDLILNGAGDAVLIEDLITEAAGAGTDEVNLLGTIALVNSTTLTLAANIENLTASQATDTKLNITGNILNNQIIGNNLANIIDGVAGNDLIYGNAGNDSIIGGMGDDNLNGNEDNDTLLGGAGNDILDGDTGADSLIGGDGNDTYFLDDANDLVEDIIVESNAATSGTDTVKTIFTYTLANSSNLENLMLTGADAVNATGNELKNVVTGNANNNILDGASNIDTLIGGLGNDTYIVNLTAAGALQDVITEVLNAGNDSVQLSGTSSNATVVTLTLAANLENLDASATGLSKLNLAGNTLDNILTGNDSNNSLSGGTGLDTLNGDAGSDSLDGGAGIDSLNGGAGDDSYLVDLVTTGTGALAVANLQDIVTENASEGTDTLTLRGSAVLINTSTISLIGTELENINASGTGTTKLNLVGNGFNNIITGNAANNIISGGLGNDTLTGGAGNDVFVIDAVGSSNVDVITDFVSGQDNIKLTDAMFDIVFSAGFVADKLLIGTSSVAQTSANYLVYNKTTGELWFSRDANGTYDIDGDGINPPELIAKFTPNTLLQWTDFLNITLRGTLGNDLLRAGRGDDFIEEQLIGDFNSGNDSAYGGDGNDIIRLGSGNDYIEGGAGNDIIYAGVELPNYSPSFSIYPDNDTVYGGDGNDSIYGGINGTDVLDGGNGDDLLSGGSYATITLNIPNALKLTGGAGNDTLIGGYGNDTLSGGAGNDSLEGGEGNDVIDGGAGNDIIRGSSKSTLLGGDGNDTLYGRGNGGAGDDTYQLNNYSLIVDTSGIDTVISYDSFTTLYTLGSTIENLIIRNANNVTVIGNSLNNILTSEAGGNATLSGEGGNDKITGYLGNDTINGGAGNDIIIGSRGADIITGGLGADLFEYHAQEDSMFSFASDIIADFSHAQLDKIDVSIIDADATTVGINDAFTFIGNNVAFSNVAGQLRFDAANNTLYGDIDGNGTADIQITFTGVTNLVAGDFIL